MEKFEVGNVVVIPFPFSDFKSEKLRPALVVGNAEFDNLIICQITSRQYSSKNAIILTKTDFAKGELQITSYIHPDKLVTIVPTIIVNTVGKINIDKKKQVLSAIRKLFN